MIVSLGSGPKTGAGRVCCGSKPPPILTKPNLGGFTTPPNFFFRGGPLERRFGGPSIILPYLSSRPVKGSSRGSLELLRGPLLRNDSSNLPKIISAYWPGGQVLTKIPGNENVYSIATKSKLK